MKNTFKLFLGKELEKYNSILSTNSLSEEDRMAVEQSIANLNEVAWYDHNSGKETHDVGQKLPNNWGFYDMHGNVEEWCRDWYDEYPLDHVVDPLGPDYGRYHVCRGGNMGGMAMGCSSSARKGGNPTNRRCYRGFRQHGFCRRSDWCRERDDGGQ